MEHAAKGEYPIHLGFAYLFLVGYFVKVCFAALKLPGAVGVILVGWSFNHFFQKDILKNRDLLQHFAFFLVLMKAGFEISLEKWPKSKLLMMLLPLSFELTGIAIYAHAAMGWSWSRSLILANVCFPLGEGLVIPKMVEFRKVYGNTLYPPRLVLNWAPVEATVGLTLYGVLAGLVKVHSSVETTWLIIAKVVNLIATLLAGACIGYCVSRLTTFMAKSPEAGGANCCDTPIFTGAGSEAFLVVLSICFACFGLSEELPLGFGSSQLFQPELFVISLGCVFAHFTQLADRANNTEILHSVEGYLNGLWTFGGIILFSMLGSRTELKVFQAFPRVLPIMGVGVVFRFLGTLTAGFLMQRAKKKTRFEQYLSFRGMIFCFLCSLPRATIQGALGTLPAQQHLFDESQEDALFIMQTARLYIVVFSIAGSLLLEVFGRKLLEAEIDSHEQLPTISNSETDTEGNASSDSDRAGGKVAYQISLDSDEKLEKLSSLKTMNLTGL